MAAMRRNLGLKMWILVAVGTAAAACSDGGNVDSGMIPSDAGPTGLWRVVEPTTINGTFEATLEGELALAHADVVDGRLAFTDGVIDDYVFFDSVYRTDARDIDFMHQAGPPERLIVDSLTTEPFQLTTGDTLTVQGTAAFESQVALVPMGAPRIGLVFLLRSTSGPPGFIQVPGADMPLVDFGFFSDVTETFDLSRTEGALGVERISYGDAFLSVGLVVVYDDVDGSGQLDEFWNGCTGGNDCVRGVSKLVVTYRFGSSAELAASPYAFVRGDGWAPSLISPDLRGTTAATGLISLVPDPAPPFDVIVPNDPIDLVLPDLQF